MKHAVATSTFAAALQLWAVQGALSERQSAGDLIINTPTNLQTCLVSQITFSGGVPPYFVSVFPEGTQTDALIQFPETQSSPVKWEVNVPADASYTIGIRDSEGNQNAAAAAPVTAGPSTDCVGQDTSGGSSGGSSEDSGSPSGSASDDSSSAGGSPSMTETEDTPEPTESEDSSSDPAPTGESAPEDGGDSSAGMLKAGAATLVLGALSALF